MPSDQLKEFARDLRIDVLKMLAEAGSGHTAGSLGMADVFAALFFGGILKYDAKNPWWEERDRLVLSNGHICPVLYASLAKAGFFPYDELFTLRKLNSRLQGHPKAKELPGIENSSGPLGQGVSQAVGMALAGKRVIAVTSDGEHEAGEVWEAVLLASKYKLNNLTLIVDRNNIQISGEVEKIMPLEPLGGKYKAFNWNVISIDGHNFDEILEAFGEAKRVTDKPSVIICKTVPGKGVSFVENDYKWHGKAPSKEEAERGIEELSKSS